MKCFIDRGRQAAAHDNCMVLSRSCLDAERNYTLPSDVPIRSTRTALRCRVMLDIGCQSVNGFRPAVTRNDLRDDGRTCTRRRSTQATPPSRQTTRPPRPLRAARSPGRNRQKVEEHDNCYSSGDRAEMPRTAGRGVSNGGPCSYQRRTGTRHAANEV